MCASGCVIVERKETLLDIERHLIYKLDHAVTDAAAQAYGDYSGVPIEHRSSCGAQYASKESRQLLRCIRKKQGVRQIEIYDNIIDIALTENGQPAQIDETVHQLAHEQLVD